MYHKTNFGRYASLVAPYADLRGYVPEAGDHWLVMVWDAAIDWDADTWREHVESAVRATNRAEQAIADWQASPTR